MKFNDLHPNIKIRIMTEFFTDITQMAILPFMAIYFSSYVGAGLAGILLMINILLSIMVGLYSGFLADRIGRKKMLVSAQAIQIFALLVMTVVNSPWLTSVWITYAMFIVSNISSSLIGPAASAMIIDVSTEKERPYIYGLGYWTGNIAIALGALLGGLFFEKYKMMLFMMFLFVSIITLFIIIFFIKETFTFTLDKSETKPSIKTGLIRNYLHVLSDRGFMLFIVATICIMSLEFQLDKYVAVRLKEQFEAELFTFTITGVNMFSIIMLINTITIVFATLQLSKWLGQFNAKKVLTIGLIIYSISFTSFAYSNSFTLLILAAFFFTFGELMYSPIRQTILASIVNEQRRASYMAVDNLAYHVATLIGSIGLSLGALLPSEGMALLYLGLGLCGLVCYRIALSMKEKKEVRVDTQKESVL